MSYGLRLRGRAAFVATPPVRRPFPPVVRMIRAGSLFLRMFSSLGIARANKDSCLHAATSKKRQSLTCLWAGSGAGKSTVARISLSPRGNRFAPDEIFPQESSFARRQWSTLVIFFRQGGRIHVAASSV